MPAYFDKHLAQPLQFGRYYLNLMPNGEAYMGGGAYLTPRDQLKRSLGQEHEYGYGWHLHTFQISGKRYRTFAAEGNGGQFVIAIRRWTW